MTTLPRLDRAVPIVDDNKCPSYPYHIWWDNFASTLEKVLTDILTAQADIFAALSSMPDIPDVTITADYTGTVDVGQLPYVVAAQRFSGTTDDTALASWSFTVDSGDLTATILLGVLTITALGASSVVTITSGFNGVNKSKTFTVTKQVAPPPAIGTGGGTSATDTTFNSFNSTTHAQVSDELTVTVAGSGNVALNAPLTVSTDNSGGAASYPVYGKWQWWDGAAWVDVGTEALSSPNCSVALLHQVHNGSLTVSQTKTGLGAASSQKFRLMARNSSGTRVMYLSGTASAVS